MRDLYALFLMLLLLEDLLELDQAEGSGPFAYFESGGLFFIGLLLVGLEVFWGV